MYLYTNDSYYSALWRTIELAVAKIPPLSTMEFYYYTAINPIATEFIIERLSNVESNAHPFTKITSKSICFNVIYLLPRVSLHLINSVK